MKTSLFRRPSVDAVATILLCVAALGASGALVHREFIAPRHTPSAAATRPTDFSQSPLYAEALEASILFGDSRAPITVVEFADIECPFCARFHGVVKQLQATHGGRLQFRVVHFPLPSHRFATPGAIAIECASEMQRGQQLVDMLFTRQDSLGLKSWASFANDAGIADTNSFNGCLVRLPAPARIAKGVDVGRRMGVHATPTVLINGWLFPTPPSLADLDNAIARILRGDAPVVADRESRP